MHARYYNTSIYIITNACTHSCTYAYKRPQLTARHLFSEGAARSIGVIALPLVYNLKTTSENSGVKL